MDRREQRGAAASTAVLIACAFFAGVIVSLGLSSHADPRPRVEVGLGNCRVNYLSGDWYNEQLESHLQPESGCSELGLRFPLEDGYSARLAWVDLGRYRTIARVNPAAEGDFGSCIGQEHANCRATFVGSGGAYGVSLALAKEWPVRDMKLGLEGGVLFYRYWWSSSMQYTTYWKSIDEAAISKVPATLLGVTARWRDFYAAYRTYFRVGEHIPVIGAIKQPIRAFTIGISREF